MRAADVGSDPSRRPAAVSAVGPSPDLESFFSLNTAYDEMRALAQPPSDAAGAVWSSLQCRHEPVTSTAFIPRMFQFPYVFAGASSVDITSW